ncbi:CPBP family intramembrane metalloprotease domain-containing protein [Caulobacter sp. D4A]|nr:MULTISPECIES: CPBP family intramembrane glutamic endopeptidase [unclassified Caulobacter]PXA85761.1 CPBP family intramembrane metalloprotease domain-containing protein [Caulobacter sp. D4A]PXA91575.1 CPBP family intramembrane metalloprotease domain-containing protein [Caulobacter sp. D5]
MFEDARGSAFLGDLTPADRRIGRVLLTLPVGVIAAALAAIIGAVFVMALFAGLAPGGFETAMALVESLRDPKAAAGSLQTLLFVLCLLAATNGGMATAFAAVAAMLHERRLKSYLTSAPSFRWRLTLLGLVLFAVTLGPLLAGLAQLDPHPPAAPILTLTPDLDSRFVHAAGAIGLLLVAAAAEELVFRGWLLKLSGAFTHRTWLVLAINGLMFSAIHFDPNPDAFLVRMVLGVGLAWATLRLGGIEFSIGAHAANNIVILLFLQPMTLAPEAPHAFRWEVVPIAAGMLALYVGLAELVARTPRLSRWAGVVTA